MRLTQAHLDFLVCPVCHGRLVLSETHIDCLGCRRRYPIVDELPVLIESRATVPDQSTPERGQEGKGADQSAKGSFA